MARGQYKGSGASGGGHIFDVMKDTSHAATPEQAAKFCKGALTGLVVFRRHERGNLIEPKDGFMAAWDANWKHGEPRRKAAMQQRKDILYPKAAGNSIEREPEATLAELLESRRLFERGRFIETLPESYRRSLK